MPKFKTVNFCFVDQEENHHSDKFEFSAKICINAKGMFYVNLPTFVVESFRSVGIDTGQKTKLNRQSAQTETEGYFESDTFDGLLAEINALGQDYVSKEIVSQRLMIEYAVETDCHYAVENGGVFPNGYYIKNKEAGNYWRSGTLRELTSGSTVYGFQIYARPFLEVVYRYRSGKSFTKKLFSSSFLEEIGENGKWLADVVRQMSPRQGTLHEIEYTEGIAGFFRSLFESLFQLNERLAEGLTPERIKLLADSRPNAKNFPLLLSEGIVTESKKNKSRD